MIQGENCMLISYARTSTAEQTAGLEAQLRDLRAIGCEKIFSEQVSSVAYREQLDAAIEFAREGDTFVVTSTFRLARSIRDLCNIVDRLKKKKVELRILKNGIDTSTPNGRLMLGLLGVIAEFEREILLERQREGVAKALIGIRSAGNALIWRTKNLLDPVAATGRSIN
jgi:DNA invertase Pin-like site-specific DNA recombinase